MVQEIKRGDLVVVTGLSTGDPQWSAELYRTRIPVLVINGRRGYAGKKPWVTVFYQGKRRHIRSNQVEIFNEKKSKEDPFMNPEDLNGWKRIPGLFRKWEFAELVEDNDSISFQKQGKAEDGTQLWALYRHCPWETLKKR